MKSLAEASLAELHHAAVVAAQGGDGDLLLSYVIWPTDDGVQASWDALSPKSDLRQYSRYGRIVAETSPNVALPREIRDHHAYREAVPGMCSAFVNLGPRWVGRVRCSRRARDGQFCGHHARTHALAA